MADTERGKDRDRRKKRTPRRDRDDFTPSGIGKSPVILAKPERERELDSSPSHGHTSDRTAASQVTAKQTQPTMILKPRDGDSRAVSPSQVTITRTRKDSDPPQPSYQLAARQQQTSETGVTALSPPVEMRTSCKLLDDMSYHVLDNVCEFLLDQPDYLVIGCLGLQGVGKSTVMSLLAGSNMSSPTRNYPFRVQNAEHQEKADNCTIGVDVYITPERVFLLDCQPLLSAAVMDRAIALEKKYASDFSSTETAMEIQSLQLTSLIFSVCHVVLVIQDWNMDPNLIRFLQTAEMLKPSTRVSSSDDERVEHFPHIVFIHNQAHMTDFSPERMRTMQYIYGLVMNKSQLLVQSNIGLASGHIIPSLNPDNCGDLINLFLLPDKEREAAEDEYKGLPPFQELVQHLQSQVFALPRTPLAQTTLSEKNWYHYVCKVWDNIRKSGLFSEYSRLLP